MTIFMIMVFIIGACAARVPLTQEQRDFAGRANNYPTSFTLPNEQAEEAWGRAQVFIATYSNMKLQIATQYVLQTFNPVGNWPRYGYNVTRMQSAGETQFAVQCMCSNMFNGKQAQQNASMLSYYMVTGELEPRFIYK